MGRIYKRAGSPYYWVRWHDSQGYLHRESSKSSDRRVATLHLSEREAAVIRQRAGVPVTHRIALADAVAEYLDAHRPPIWSEKWHRTSALWFRSRIIPALGGHDAEVSALDRRAAQRARDRWVGPGGVSPPTVNRICAVASGFFKWAIEREYAERNPFTGIKRFAEQRHNPPRLTRAQLDLFLASFRNDVVRRAATLALDTALRLSELRRINLDDVDVTRCVLRVVSSYKRGHTKTRKERVIPLTPRALAALQGGDRPFPLARLPLNIRKALATAQRVAGLPAFRWHDMRHYALTAAADAGLQGHDLTLLAGWSTMAMADRYIHPGIERMRAALCAPSVPEGGTIAAQPEHTRDTEQGPTPTKH